MPLPPPLQPDMLLNMGYPQLWEQPAETLFNNTTLAGPFLPTKGQRGWEARAVTKDPCSNSL